MESFTACASCGLKHRPRPDGLCPRCKASADSAPPPPQPSPKRAARPFVVTAVIISSSVLGAFLAVPRHPAQPQQLAPQPVVNGPPVQIDYCQPEIDRRMTECVPRCHPGCRYAGGGHVCRYKPGESNEGVEKCIDDCGDAAESICMRLR
jgi:hypothetical protein